MSDLRHRRPPVDSPAALEEESRKKKRQQKADDEEDSGISFVDILRVLSGLLLLSCTFSWLITDGESFTWGYRPRLSRWRHLKNVFVSTLVVFTRTKLLCAFIPLPSN
jgi:hypothetical protein